MNERIRELSAEAWRYANNYIGEDVMPQLKRYEQKFVELIVRECISISESHAKNLESQPSDPNFEQYEDGIVNGIYEATAAIREHFGFEE